MKLNQLLSVLLLTSLPTVLHTTLAKSEEIAIQGDHLSTKVSATSQPVAPTKVIPRLSEVARPITSAQILAQSPPTKAQVIQITSVKANPTAKGVEVILQTSVGEQLQVTNRSSGNSFIADIPNAQLRLPSGETFIFRSEKPLPGITEIIVINLDANTVRVTVTGEALLPTVELFDSPNEGLIFSVATAAFTQQPQQPQPSQKPAPSKPESETQPDKPSSSGDEPIELVVTGEQDGYRTPDATTPTKTDTPLRDIPQSIQVIPQQVIKDQQVTRVGDALRNVSGVQQPANTSRSHFDIFFIRGFSSVNEGVLRNGLRDRTNTRIGSEVANLERIEVLKGPSAALYGQGGLGGTINLITKQPLQDPFYSVEAFVGNFDFYRGAIDFSGPLNSDKTLLYRLNAAGESSGSFVDFVESQTYFVAPVLTWLISDKTKLTFEAEYVNSPKRDEWGLPAEGTVLPNPNGKIPLNRYVGEPTEEDNRSAFRVGYNLEHRFSKNWQVRNAFRASFFRNTAETNFPASLRPDKRTLQRNSIKTLAAPTDIYTLDSYIVGKFNTGSIQHQIVAGFDLFRELNSTNLETRTSTIDIFNPAVRTFASTISRQDNKFTRDALGLYIQDQITLFENLKLLLGGRFDIISEKYEDFIPITRPEKFRQNEAFSPRVGIVYQPIKPISLYASYNRSFTQVTGTTFDTTLFEPERGTQYEVGIKADLNDKISATLAFYDITRSNVLITNPSDTRFSLQVGEQKSRGIELDIGGEILPDLNIIASYAYTDAYVSKEPLRPQLVDNTLNNVPKHSASLWTTYEIQTGSFQGLGFGLGFYYVGDRQGDIANSFEIPNYVRTDAAIFYKRNNFRAAVNIKNLFDITYFESVTNNLRVYPGAPVTVQGTIAWEF
ncbi:TonB-dependent receptor [Iningainema tapete]|uniref:TonB-dependent receptor n=1 Tax=Iningainema tapete BLCC-T55 TaxID=2748662 RepID=A0A8J7CG27_9CYAN|nr:TonB-dependent receptor [Iningainema tapete]MBD2775785.1 TonB-dependent receptor [Iningainema tapete BLCC-T55]